MIALINRLTGTTMYVADDRVVEYLAQGHKLAIETQKQAAPKQGEKPQPKKTVKKTTKKK